MGMLHSISLLLGQGTETMTSIELSIASFELELIGDHQVDLWWELDDSGGSC
jgi:hypothetical protein